MACEDCCKKDENDDFTERPCCETTGTCCAYYTEYTISMCICCGGEMHKEEGTGIWRHYSQMELPIKERYSIHVMEYSHNYESNTSQIIRSFRKHWRRHGAKYCLISLIGGIWSVKIIGIANLLMLTVPCSSDYLNTNKRMWYLRQLYFLIVGLIFILL